VRRALPGVKVALAVAVHRVALRYVEIPEARRPDVNGERWRALEAEIDARCGAGDREGALQAIARWEEHATQVLGAGGG
jgi:hypothetical protein